MRAILRLWIVLAFTAFTSARAANIDDPEPCKACAISGNLSSMPVEFITN